ncbi:MAG: catalase/peroxidase HPI [SAR86 cluster bacterium]|uniref:Catalase-peroxidase n=1 Tax=SAR86 cluster bacterium TaxID=2030880 RepID=A0A2A5AWT8_9GAMM|nr:MAG: catalase/peroxidase HPI [SAR86 cluster bacterium]
MLKQTISAITIAALGLSVVAPINLAHAQDPMATNDYWWPNRLSLDPLRQNSMASNPMEANFDYAEAFSNLDLGALTTDLEELMTTSQDWWPADFGHYGPFFIRMAWHSAGTYRTLDGRGGADGGTQRFAPLNSWPDNANLDKARLLLLPLKKKYGHNISWADLMILAGTVAMDSMGFETLGFAGGRIDAWQPEEVNWGSEGEWLGADRRDASGELGRPFGATQMGLIYVNPEGPGGNADPQAAADAIREAFGRMAMNDEDTAALIAGGHTFGKAHGAASPSQYVGAEPEAEAIEAQGQGWLSSYGSGNGSDTITSGLEGAWTSNPAAWTHDFLVNLYTYDWVQTQSPAGATQWKPARGAASGLVPDASDSSIRHAPMMFTTDLALKVDPIYREITSRWLDDPEEFSHAFARAWFKLTHRDMGPASRYLGDLVPDQEFVWQDPVPAVDYNLVNTRDINRLKREIMESGLTTSELVRTAWASASTFRGTDMRGGANGARIRLAPQNDWSANDPQELARVLETLEGIQGNFNSRSSRKQVSLADMIVLAGAAAIEQAAEQAGYEVEVPFTPGRGDASQAQTDVNSFALLEPVADGFRNYFGNSNSRSPAEMLIEKAALLGLTVPEMTALIGGMRALDANAGQSRHGVFTARPGTLSNDFFVNLIDVSVKWSKSTSLEGVYEGHDRATGEPKWTATPVDLIFGSNSELRAIAEFYASDDAQEKFVQDFVAAWTKVMTLDRFDLM